MLHLRPQFAILAGAFALAVLVSLFASTPAFYQKLSLAAHSLVPAEMAAGHGMTVFDLGQPSLAAEFDCVARQVAGLPAPAGLVSSTSPMTGRKSRVNTGTACSWPSTESSAAGPASG